MFSWLRRLFSRKNPTARIDLFDPGERAIYSYFDGTRVVHADPLVLYRRVTAVGQELASDIKASASTLSAKVAEAGRLGVLAKARSVFGIVPLGEDGSGGLTEGETTALLDHFLYYCEELKKNWNPPSTPPTGPSPPTPPSPGGGPATPSSSGSPSTAPGGTAAAPP